MPVKPCRRCGGGGQILKEVTGDPRTNGQDRVATVQRWVTCDACGGSGTVEAPDDQDGRSGGRR